MNQPDRRKVLSVYPDAETKEWVEKVAASSGRSASNWVLNLIREERNKKLKKK